MSEPGQEPEPGTGLGTGMLVLFWVGVLGLGTWIFGGVLGIRDNPNGAVQGTFEGGVAEVRLAANPQGHYVAEGLVNGREVVMMVDTGATSVAVPEAWADRLGLRRGPEVSVMTANGEARAWLTRIDRLQLGSLEFRNVEANIAPGLSGEILLGMSALGSVEFTQRDRELVLRQMR